MRSHLDIVSLVVEIQIPHYIMDLDGSRKRLFEDSMNGPTPDVPIQDIFALYRRTKTLLGMYTAFCPKSVDSSYIDKYKGLNCFIVVKSNSIWADSSSHTYANG